MDLDYGVDRPSTGDRVDNTVHIMTELLASTKWYVINRVGAEYVLGVEIARRIISTRIVEVLIIGVSWYTLRRTPSTVITAVVRHAFGEGVSDLIFQTTRIALLEHSLKSVVLHLSD